MTKIFCSHEDCKHNDKKGICQSKTVELSEDYYEPFFLKCLDYQKGEEKNKPRD